MTEADHNEPRVGASRFLAWAEPGHFYSPIPDLDEIDRDAARIFAVPDELAGIDLRFNEQVALFSELAELANELNLPDTLDPRFRYYVENPNYGIGDASMLAAFLRYLRPRRYLEVGSGWSTALALDVNEHWLDNTMSISAIEPHPELLRGLLQPGDDVEIIESRVQDVPIERFGVLEENDVLFIDCTHVVKIGSDAHFIITKVLPSLATGVVIHIHDIFWPFEYLRSWVTEGRAWNEAYVLHAFLTNNAAFEIAFFNHWFSIANREAIATKLPRMLENPGGAIWLRRAR